MYNHSIYVLFTHTHIPYLSKYGTHIGPPLFFLPLILYVFNVIFWGEAKKGGEKKKEIRKRNDRRERFVAQIGTHTDAIRSYGKKM
jgi:hypothetical protein